MGEQVAGKPGSPTTAEHLHERADSIQAFVAALRNSGEPLPALDLALHDLDRSAALIDAVAEEISRTDDLGQPRPGLHVASVAATDQFVAAAAALNSLLDLDGGHCFDGIEPAEADHVADGLEAACLKLESVADDVAAVQDGTVAGLRRYFELLPELFGEWLDVAAVSRPEDLSAEAWTSLLDDVGVAVDEAVDTTLEQLDRFDGADSVEEHFASVQDKELNLDDVLQRVDETVGFDCFFAT